MKHLRLLAIACILSASSAVPLVGQTPAGKITTPKEHLGFNLGDDYCLANYKQLQSYWTKLEKESDRLKVVTIGMSEEGRPQLMGVVTSPANHKRIEHYKSIARRLALAEGINDAEAKKLAAEGKAVIWLDGGLHASESLCAQVLMETLYQYLVADDAESRRILDDVIILFVQCNPDGQDLIADWYMRNPDPTKRSLAALPRLYQKYIGHDNNRDSYANTQAETKNIARVMYREWIPQIVYNHHQSGPAGTVVFIPPCRDPNNYNLDPLVLNGIEAISTNMVQRYLSEGKPGATVRTGARYSTWWNGGLSTTCQFHNIIGLFTETVGGPTPSQIPYIPTKLLRNEDYLAPIQPQKWHFRQSMDYSVSGNKSILDYASRNRERLLYNIWRMGQNSIERGSQDSWTVTPKMVEAAKVASAKAVSGKEAGKDGGKGGKGGFGGGKGGFGGSLKDYERFFRDPAKRDARGYILPSSQPDFLTATRFVNTLIGTGVKVHRSTAAFEAAGKQYPAGSYVVKCAQAFRPHVVDMFEPQDHPNDFAYPGAPPTPPYDAAGYTPAFQMGVRFDRILDGFDGPFEELKDEVPQPPARVTDDADTLGYVLDTRMNDAFRAVNRLLKAGEVVRRLDQPFVAKGSNYPAGTFYIPKKATTRPLVTKIAGDIGTPFVGSPDAPGKALTLKPVRIALWDRYGGSMPSGWTRWLFEQFEFPFTVVYPPELDQGNLREKFDVIIFPDGAIAQGGGGMKGGGGGGKGGFGGDKFDEKNIPEEYRGRRGEVSRDKTLPKLREFLEAGGTILTVGSSTTLARQLGVPLANHLAVKDEDGAEKPLSREKFFVPSSVLRVRVDPKHPLAWGMPDDVDVMFANSPTFRLGDAKGIERVAWFDGKAPLRSGWAWGQEHLADGVAVADAAVGQGRLVAFGPQITFRAQPHGTFKLLFNAIVRAGARE
jgi:Zinc carboxypeptidase